MDELKDVVAEFLRLGSGDLGHGAEEWVLNRRDDDAHELLFTFCSGSFRGCCAFLCRAGGGEGLVLAGVLWGEEDHVNGLLFCLGGFAVLDEFIRLDGSLVCHFSDGLQGGGFEFALHDGLDGVIRAVEADDDDVLLASSEESRLSAESHGVVAADDALDVGVSLEDGLHDGVGFGLAPVGGLLSDHLHIGELVEDVVIALGADVRVGVGVLAGEFDVSAFFFHELSEVFGEEGSALVVVGDDLGSGDAFFGDLTVNEEGRDASVFGFLDCGDGGVCAGVIEDDGGGFLGDAGFKEFHLLVGVVVVDELKDVVAEFLRLGGGDLGHGTEEWVLNRRDDDAHQFLTAFGGWFFLFWGSRFFLSCWFFCSRGWSSRGSASAEQDGQNHQYA